MLWTVLGADSSNQGSGPHRTQSRDKTGLQTAKELHLLFQATSVFEEEYTMDSEATIVGSTRSVDLFTRRESGCVYGGRSITRL